MTWLREVNGETLLTSGFIAFFSPSLLRIDPAGSEAAGVDCFSMVHMLIFARSHFSALLVSIAARFAV
jgi:hypothetical protein